MKLASLSMQIPSLNTLLLHGNKFQLLTLEIRDLLPTYVFIYRLFIMNFFFPLHFFLFINKKIYFSTLLLLLLLLLLSGVNQELFWGASSIGLELV